jgi:hypothetical protein
MQEQLQLQQQAQTQKQLQKQAQLQKQIQEQAQALLLLQSQLQEQLSLQDQEQKQAQILLLKLKQDQIQEQLQEQKQIIKQEQLQEQKQVQKQLQQQKILQEQIKKTKQKPIKAKKIAMLLKLKLKSKPKKFIKKGKYFVKQKLGYTPTVDVALLGAKGQRIEGQVSGLETRGFTKPTITVAKKGYTLEGRKAKVTEYKRRIPKNYKGKPLYQNRKILQKYNLLSKRLNSSKY